MSKLGIGETRLLRQIADGVTGSLDRNYWRRVIAAHLAAAIQTREDPNMDYVIHSATELVTKLERIEKEEEQTP